jgi:hypothetical protein
MWCKILICKWRKTSSLINALLRKFLITTEQYVQHSQSERVSALGTATVETGRLVITAHEEVKDFGDRKSKTKDSRLLQISPIHLSNELWTNSCRSLRAKFKYTNR